MKAFLLSISKMIQAVSLLHRKQEYCWDTEKLCRERKLSAQCNSQSVKWLLKNSLIHSTYCKDTCFFSTLLHKYKNKIIKKVHHIMSKVEATKLHWKLILKAITASYRDHFTHPWSEDTLDKTQHLFTIHSKPHITFY